MAKRREIWYTGTEHRRHVYRIGEAYEKTACLDWRDSAGAAAYLIVPNWILAKPREALIESVRQELAADWQSEAVAFVGEGVYSGETVLWFTIETPGNTQYKAAVCRVLENGRYRLTKIESPSTYCSDIVSYLAVYLVNNPDCRTIITKGSTSDGEIRIDLTPEELPYVYIADPPVSSSTTGFYDAAGAEMQFR